MDLSLINKITKKIIWFLLFLCVVFPYIADATIYQPGETLEPDCAPSALNCGVATISPAHNLSDLADVPTARANLGLGTLATQSGTFSGSSTGINTGDQTTISGNAGTATALQTPRAINGISFDGTADITITATASAGTLTGATLASNILSSSLTSVGTLLNLTVTNPISGSIAGSSGSATGNAGTATALQTPRTINGVSFNGTADITTTSAAGTLTGATLAANVLNSSLTSVGTLTNLTVTNPISGSITGSSGSTTGNAATVTTNANLTGAVTSVGNAASLGSFTSANLSGALTDETGTGVAVFANTPLLVTPNIGAATGSSLNLSAGAITSGLVNSQTISSAANFTGTVAVGTSISINGAAASVKSSGTNAITFDSNSTGAVNIGNSNNSKIINIGIGTQGNSINIGTNNTNADTIIIGSALDALSFSSTGLNVTAGGALTGVQSIDTIAFAPTSITFAVNGIIKSTTGSAMTLDSGTTGTVNLGASNDAKTINIGTGNAGNILNIGTGNAGNTNTLNIGSTSGATQLNLSAGTGGVFLAGAAAADAGSVALCINSLTNQLFLGLDASTCDPSSARYKHDITDIGLGLDAVNALRPVSYVYNSNNEAKLGFIAEEAAAVDERLVVRDKGGVIQGIKPDAFTPVLTRAIQQLSARLDDVTAEAKMFSKKAGTDDICLTKSDGSVICINGDQLSSLLQQTSNNSVLNNTGASTTSTNNAAVTPEQPATPEITVLPEEQPGADITTPDVSQ